ncbi:MAG: GNAT family N-acetyltransferase, partial [Actinobacteria bacterium]|nr:GNAT family N-acetyltransferase [Actinomycetota bacterium]
IRLTPKGLLAFEDLDRRATAEVAEQLAPLSDAEQARLFGAMEAIGEILGGTHTAPSFVLRPLGPSDFGWVVSKHGELYSREYGWDENFEALVARIIADYIERRNPKRDAAWIAEVDGRRVGCVFCVEKEPTVAQLRLLLVDPKARGMGIGARLVEECIRFATAAGYERMMLWTNDILTAARRIYEGAGFALTKEEPHHSFGHDLVSQDWWLDLRG